MLKSRRHVKAMKTCTHHLVGQLQGLRAGDKHRRKYAANIELDLRGKVFVRMQWTRIGQWQSSVKTVIIIGFHKSRELFDQQMHCQLYKKYIVPPNYLHEHRHHVTTIKESYLPLENQTCVSRLCT